MAVKPGLLTHNRHWMDYIWRRLHALGDCYHVSYSRDEWHIDVGYCLDRYSIEDEQGLVTTSRP